MGIATLPALKRNGDDLAGLRVVAETGRIRHANELVFDHGLGDLERLWHDGARSRSGSVR
jgi:hypothetical protein